jgi:ferritin
MKEWFLSRSFYIWKNLTFMVSDTIITLINEQITKEQYAAQLYLSMSAWFYSQDLEGIANYFRVQSKEELMHADKMFDYVHDIGGKIILNEVPKPPHEFNNAQEIFEKALEHERLVTKSIFNIVKAANDEGDFATTSFLQWFINEQVEEESSASLLVTKIKMVKDNPSALYLLIRNWLKEFSILLRRIDLKLHR